MRKQAPPGAAGADELEQWMQAYGRDVLNVAYAYVRNHHLAQDIAQEVFLRAFVKRMTLRQANSVRTWLLSITVNLCRDVLRSWSQRHLVVVDELPVPAAPANTEEEAVARLERAELWQAIQALPLPYREVVVLYYLRGLSGREVAEILGTTEDNVRTRLHRARTRLHAWLTAKGERRLEAPAESRQQPR
ncbi:MAG: sigma-70 family RNA polymerase sigma factor [Alicyclobacillus sp.]|nr:sigma-70 family RNA polymerase sigma factor [Alicyclobacillus sp.]